MLTLPFALISMQPLSSQLSRFYHQGSLELSSSAANTWIPRGAFMQTGDLIDFVGLAGLKWEQSPCIGLVTQRYENRARCHRCGYIIRMCRGEVIRKRFFWPYFLKYWWYKQFAVANISNSFSFYSGVFLSLSKCFCSSSPLTFYSINPSWLFFFLVMSFHSKIHFIGK